MSRLLKPADYESGETLFNALKPFAEDYLWGHLDWSELPQTERDMWDLSSAQIKILEKP